jgi:hypothetical protein
MNRLKWFGCWLAFRACMVLSIHSRAFTALLPFAGIYAFSDSYEDAHSTVFQRPIDGDGK